MTRAASTEIDAQRLTLLLNELRLPAVKHVWGRFAERSDSEGWPAARFLRQGVRANGWVLLSVVPVGYELWRQFNGFPPAIAPSEPGAPTDAKAGGAPSKEPS